MALNQGKAFEAVFKKDWEKTFGDNSIDRIYDSVSGYATISNISDFIGYYYPNIFYLECKSHKGASIPIANITQYDKLKKKVGIKGVRAGVVLWLIDKDKLYYIPVSTITSLLADDYKSINPDKLIPLGYNIIEIPATKKRAYMYGDYSVLAMASNESLKLFLFSLNLPKDK